jgi:hypothetical protein
MWRCSNCHGCGLQAVIANSDTRAAPGKYDASVAFLALAAKKRPTNGEGDGASFICMKSKSRRASPSQIEPYADRSAPSTPISPACGASRDACLERATEARSQARDHRDIDGVALGDLGQRLARGAALDGLLPLVVRQLRLATELDTLGHSALAAIASAFAD